MSARQRRRREWLARVTPWRRKGSEELHGDVLLTHISRKPPAYAAESVTASGEVFKCALQKAPPGHKGWDVIIPSSSDKGEAGIRTLRVPTKAAAIKAIEGLQVVKHEKGRRDD